MSAISFHCPYNKSATETVSLTEDNIIALSFISSFDFPCLNLFQFLDDSESYSEGESPATKHNSTFDAQKRAVQNLTKSLNYEKSKIKEIPHTITKSLLHCFASIIEANLFQYFKRNVCSNSKPAKSIDNQRARRLSSTYFCKNKRYDGQNNISFEPITLESGATSFEIVSQINFDQNKFSAPLNVNITLFLKVGGKVTKVVASCGGNIAGIFNTEGKDDIDCIDLRINASELLFLLRQEARKIILRTISFRRDLLRSKISPITSTVVTPTYSSIHATPSLINNHDLVSIPSNITSKSTRTSIINEVFTLTKVEKTIGLHK